MIGYLPRYYKLGNYIATHLQQLPIAKFVGPLRDQCPEKNLILGEAFTRFVRCMNIYTNPDLKNGDRYHPPALRQLYSDSLERASTKCSKKGRLELITTDDKLPNDIIQSLEQWKASAPEIITKLGYTGTTDPIEMKENLNYVLIGGYLQKYGMKNTLRLMDWLGVVELPESDEIWPKLESPYQRAHSAELRKKFLCSLNGYEYVEQKLQYNFVDKAYLLQSFSHGSFEDNIFTPTYHGLAWIGNTIFNYAITRFLFKEKPTLDVEHLSEAINLLQSSTNFGVVSARNGFHKYLRYMNTPLERKISCFVRHVRRQNFKPIDDLHLWDTSGNIVQLSPFVPQSFRALLGGIFFDSAMDINAVTTAITNVMPQDIENACKSRVKNAFVRLYELDNSAKYSEPEQISPWQVKARVMLPKHGNASFEGFAGDLSTAQWAAAKAAIRALGK